MSRNVSLREKTMEADMICAYYDQTAESRELFEHQGCCKVEPH